MNNITTIERPRSDETIISGADKIASYRWTVKDRMGEFRLIGKNQLVINEEYQRAAISTKILEFARNWSWLACGVILVAHRDGSFWVIDGQHRVIASRKRSDIRELPCLVFETGEVAEEARGFLDCNTNRKPITAIAKHRAAVVAGDELAGMMQMAFDDLGLRVSDSPSSPADIRCVSITRGMASENFDQFQVVLSVAAELAKEAGIVMQDRLLQGLWYLHRNMSGGVISPRLRKRLSDVGAVRLVDSANRAAAYFAKGGAKVYATGMLETLNKNLQRRFEFSAATNTQGT